MQKDLQSKTGYKREAEKGSGDPGNSHSRAASGTPCDFRRSACLFPPLAAAGSGPGRGFRGEAPNVSHREAIKKRSQGAKRYLTVGDRIVWLYLSVESMCFESSIRRANQKLNKQRRPAGFLPAGRRFCMQQRPMAFCKTARSAQQRAAALRRMVSA